MAKQATSSKIPRYDLEQGDTEAEAGGAMMVLHRSGDYVEYSDHAEVVAELQSKIDNIQRAVNAALAAVRGEAD